MKAIELLLRADGVLRREPWTTQSGRSAVALGWLLALLACSGALYGAAMGSFGASSIERWFQVLYSAIKVPMLLVVTFLLGLPSFFVANTLMGLRRDFVQALRALVAAQAGVAIVLCSLAPLTLFWYSSDGDYGNALRINLLMFAVASLAAQTLLRGYYRPLVERNARHRWMLRVWLVLYALVGVQMAWVLRPFVGSPGTPPQFFREDSWGNAYVVVAKLLWRMLSG